MARPTLSVLLDAVEIGDRVSQITIRQGSQSPFDGASPGGLSMLVDNFDRAFDPTYASGTYYGNLTGNINVVATHDSQSYTIAAAPGRYHQWTLEPSPPEDGVAVVTCRDALQILAQFTAQEPFGGSDYSPADALQAACDLVGLTVNVVESDDGVSIVNDIDTGNNLLTYARAVVDGEMGWLTAIGEVDLRFVSRNYRWASSTATLTDDPASDAQFLYEGSPKLVYAVGGAWGGVKATREGGTTQRWPDGGVDGAYEAPELPIGGLVFTSDSQALELATERWSKSRSPGVTGSIRWQAVTLNPDAIGTDEMWAFVLGLFQGQLADQSVPSIGARVTVVQTPPVGAAITRDCFIEGYEMSIPVREQGGAWTVTLYLSDAEPWPTSVFTLDDATLGKLNTGGVLG